MDELYQGSFRPERMCPITSRPPLNSAPKLNGWYWTYRRRFNGNDFSWHIEGRLKTARRILHELTPEEMEEAFQQHLTERNKEKTA